MQIFFEFLHYKTRKLLGGFTSTYIIRSLWNPLFALLRRHTSIANKLPNNPTLPTMSIPTPSIQYFVLSLNFS